MNAEQARDIIERLAQGLQPQHEDALPQDSPFQQPPVIRALFVASQALASQVRRESRRPPGKAGKPWTAEEDQQLAASFDAGLRTAALAEAHQRSRGAITARLVRLGRLHADGREAVRA